MKNLKSCFPKLSSGRSAVFTRRVITLALAAAALPVAAATNVLVNPGFESGDFSGWTAYGAGHAVESTNNTYYNGGQPGGSNVLTHTGGRVGKTYGSFTGGYNANGAFQDAVAAAGSVWSAGGFALSHQQDFIQAGNQFWLELSFRDTSDTVLGLYRSYIIDPNSADGVISNLWYALPITNVYDISDSTYSTITNSGTSFTAPPGTAKARVQMMFAQLGGYPGGSVYFDDIDLTKIAGSDPDITQSPSSHTRIEGQSVTFSVTAGGATALSYQWQKDGGDLASGGNVSGATSSSLTISNVTAADAGSYSVTVSDANGSLSSAPATLTIVTAVDAINYLGNPGFEQGTSFAPFWTPYNGAAIQAGYVHDGIYAGQAYSDGPGSYNGFFQDARTDDIHTVSPGSVFAADGWALTPSANQIGADNTAWIEVHFHDANGNIIGLYKSAVIDASFTPDIWVNLPVTNIIAFWSDYSVVGSAKYLTAPAGTAYVRYQTVMHIGTGGGAGVVDFDDLRLISKPRVAITASTSSGGIRLSFQTQVNTSYEVRYKNDLLDADWQLLTTVNGNGAVQTVTDPATAAERFYIVNTL
jgi:hypothetical protein